ncbi:type II secretion system protein GspL [Thalassomonas sp. M1454]|uniref:type II secretion system protein GspL n=1 Tax=Thalassomonas sp. M1454 TaxID=2594477 RepID=UPI0011803F5E|nr:type II secretion system protein GspL [Thalassomonas sp. M1454]TRX57893.1 type II secretion system protein GspL [Thalassomonas sp. M1454]
MKETLFIRIGSQETSPIQWLITNDQLNDEIASGVLANKDALPELTEKAQGRDVRVLLDSSDIRLKAIKVPGKSERAIKSAAPYMLEDELSHDVEQLFFAFHGQPKGYDGDENCFMAIVLQEQMDIWLTWFAQANIMVKQMLPDVLALPQLDNCWSALMIEEQLLLRKSAWDGLVCDKSIADFLLQQMLADHEEQVSLNCYSPVELDCDKVEIESQPEELPLLLLAKGYQKQDFNLLQGEYLVKEQRSPVVKNWLWVAGIALFAFVLNLSGKVFELVDLNSQYAAINEQIERDYKQAFPKTKRFRINTVKRQLNTALSEFGGVDQSVGLLALINKVRPSFVAVPNLKPDSIRFDSKRNELRFAVTANDYQSFEKFKLELEKSNLIVEVGAQNNQGDKVVGSFNIRSKS